MAVNEMCHEHTHPEKVKNMTFLCRHQAKKNVKKELR